MVDFRGTQAVVFGPHLSHLIYIYKSKITKYMYTWSSAPYSCYTQGFQSGPVPGTFTRLRSCIVPAEITEPPKISGGQNHKYDGQQACGIFFIKN